MKLHKTYNIFDIFLFDDILYGPNSVDNSKNYSHIYSDKNYDDHLYLTRHGIEIYQSGNLISSALVISSGGTTGMHETSSIVDSDRLLVCCAHSVFCLSLPELEHIWRTTADTATCFGIFNITFELDANSGELLNYEIIKAKYQ